MYLQRKLFKAKPVDWLVGFNAASNSNKDNPFKANNSEHQNRCSWIVMQKSIMHDGIKDILLLPQYLTLVAALLA